MPYEPNVKLEDFFNNDEMKMNVFKAKYLGDHQYVDEAFHHICGEIALVSCEPEPKKWTEQWTEEWMDDLWRSGGSVIAAANSPRKKISVFNCTTLAFEGDSLKDINKTRADCMAVAAHRQGVGIDFSPLRPRGAPINNAADESEGAVHWMKSFDHIAYEVGQRGRKPAILCSLKVSHPDIFEFIGVKDDTSIMKNVNISVQVTDKFMAAVKNDEEWTMEFVVHKGDKDKERLFQKKAPARALFELLCEHAWLTGEPGIQFIDLMKRFSIQEALGYPIVSTNACSEKPVPKNSVCGLASANMRKVPHVNDPEFKPYIQAITRSMVRFMDNTVQYEIDRPYKSPTPEQLDMVAKLREIGLGITNLHGWLYDQGFQYDSDEGIAATEEFFRWYFYYAFKASVELAQERGPCPAWQEMKDLGTLAMKKFETEFLKQIFEEFPDLEEDYYKIGLRNGALISIAPTGTLSKSFSEDTLSTGIEPIPAWCYWIKTRAITKDEYQYFFNLPEAVKNLVIDEIEKKMAAGEEVPKEDIITIYDAPLSVLDEEGEIGNSIIPLIKKYVDTKVLRSAHKIDVNKKLEMMGKVQRYVDAAISVTYNLPEDFPKEGIADLYMGAYDRNIKALSVYREGSREGILIFKFPDRKSTKIQIDQTKLVRPDDIVYAYAPKRPRTLPFEAFNVLKHKVVVGLMNNKPYEIFILEQNGKKIPNEGFLTRKNKSTYVMTDEEDNVVIENIIGEQVANDEISAITRLASSSLRHGVPIDFLSDQLKKCGDSISSYPKILGRAIAKYKFLMLENVQSNVKCDKCGEEAVYYESGCSECLACGDSKCM